ncbi:MAG: hypothetical protein WCJ63_08935, partial [Actinomycetes bacterium]
MESLAAEILSIIAAADGPLRARDILEVFESRGQEADKKAINQTLYSDLAEKVEKVNGNQWQLAEPNAPSARPEAETNSSDSPEVTTPLTAALSDKSGVEPEWRFERVGAQGKDRGGITAFEVFRQQNTLSPLEVLVRESIQNSCDARQEDLPADVPVRVNFHLRELNGAAATSFLDAMGWDSLSPHVESTASQAGTLQDRIERDGLSQVKDLSIRVMTIADYGTEGLWGEEGVDGPVEGNFHRLVRAEMKTHEEGSSTTGGSFGLGKAIYWMTSGVSTVLLHSVPANAINAGQQRLIGCTWLPSHTTGDGKLWNSDGGWFGAPDEDVDGRPRTVSLWSEDAADTADALGIPRAQGEYGTSFAIVAFDNPDEDDEPDVAATCDALRRFVVKWYWPAICAKSLRVSVTGQVDDKV